MPALARLLATTATVFLTACADTTDDGEDRSGPAIIVGDEDKADGATGVELVGFVAPAAPVENLITTSTPRVAYLYYAAAGTKVDVEVTRTGSASGLDTVLKVYGPRDATGAYPTKLGEDDDAGYGKLSKLTGKTMPAAGFYLVEVTTKTAVTAPAKFRLAVTCSGGTCERPGPVAPIGADMRWIEKSAEARALSLQSYAVATARLDELAAEGLPSAWAVVMDIDETTLVNVVYQRERAELGTGYSPASWLAWVQRKAAPAQPGAKAFTERVRALGGKVVLVSNRKAGSECDPTALNLAAVGIRYDAMLCKTGTSDKNPRFEAIEDGTAPNLPALTTVMYVGDNIKDFPNLSQDVRSEADGAFADFGHRYILVANPMYGSWESNP
jgi:5'-nucleotidase (lipoprotein e(P4) family)